MLAEDADGYWLPLDESVEVTTLPLGRVTVFVDRLRAAVEPDDVGTMTTTTPPLGNVVVVVNLGLLLISCAGVRVSSFGKVVVLPL